MTEFSFTYTKLKGYEECGRKHKAELDKRVPPPSGEAIDYGNDVHIALHKAIKDDVPLPPRLSFLQYWVDCVKGLPGERFVEEKWGLSKDFQPTEFFQRNKADAWPWMRLIVDVAVVDHEKGEACLIDWKTGKRLEEPLQLWLGAALLFQKFPHVHTVHSMFVWLKEHDGKNHEECMSIEVIKRDDLPTLWDQILPRIQTYEEAVATNTFYPSPGRHCRFCKLLDCKERAA